MNERDLDFAVMAYREDGEWRLVEAGARHATDLDKLFAAMERFPSDVGVIAMVSIDEDFFVLARLRGQETEVVLSDVQAVQDHSLAAEVAEFLDEDEDHDEDVVAVGDFDLLADLGLSAMELELLCDDTELYPDEMLTDIAKRLGFGPQFEELVS